MLLKLMDVGTAPDTDPRKGCAIISLVCEAKLIPDEETKLRIVYQQCPNGKLLVIYHVLKANAYLMTDEGKTIQTFTPPNRRLPTSDRLVEQVIRTTPGAETIAKQAGFELIDEDEASLTITVSSRVRQVGQTAIAGIIMSALNRADFRNVTFEQPGLGDLQKDYPIGFDKNIRPMLKITVIDKPQHLK
jgi:hypothetical protein